MQNYDLFKADIIFSDLKCCILPAKYYGTRLQNVYLDAYEFWSLWWGKTFSEINLSFSHTSEEFCRHDAVITLYKNNIIIAVALMDIFDLKNEVHRRHKYFIKYTNEIIDIICQLANEKPILTFEYLAIAPEYRKKYCIADIVVGLALKKLITSQCNIMIGYSRNLRKTNELMYRMGAKPIQKGLTVNGEASDFVYFDKRNTLHLKKHRAHDVIEKLWKQNLTETEKINETNNIISTKGEYYEYFKF